MRSPSTTIASNITASPLERVPRRAVAPTRLVLAALDLMLAAGAAVIGFAGLCPLLFLYCRFRPRRARRCILHLVNGSIDATRARSGLYYYGRQGLLGDLDGYFERVFAVFHFTRRRRVARPSETSELIDYHLDSIGFLEAAGFHALRVVINELGYLVYVTRLIRREAVSVIQVAEPYISGFNGALVAKLAGCHLAVLVMADYDVHHRLLGSPTFQVLGSRRVEKLIERIVFRQARLVVADRHYYAEYAFRNGVRPEVVTVFPMSVHPLFYREPPDPREARRELGFDGEPHLLYVGRLSPEKHVPDLIEVLGRLAASGQRARLAIAGDGPLRDRLVARAEELGVADRLVLLGQLGVEDLRLAYAAADVVLGTHMGFTLLEAALCASPVVAYDWEWHSEILSDGETGRLVPFGDSGRMAEAAAALLADPDVARGLGRRARQICIEKYQPGRNVEELRRAYAQFFD